MATNIEGNTLESWTVYSGNPKVGNTGATVTTTSATYANAMLNNVTSSTTTGNVAVDFVWKNHALQPNDSRTVTPTAVVTGANSSTNPGYITFTTSAAHGFTQGQQVNIAGIPDTVVGAVGSLGNPLNFTNSNIASVPSTTTFCLFSPLPASLTGLSASATIIPEATVTYGGTDNVQWANTSTVASATVDYTKDSHELIEANYSNFPSFKEGSAKLHVTAVSGDGTTVTYTAQSVGYVPASLVGKNVTITGLTTSAFNLTNATIASATAYQFTVTNSAGSGVSLTGQYGIAQLGAGAVDSDGAYVGTTAYAVVPNVLGVTTANAQAILGAGEFKITTATAATNTAIAITAAARTAASSTATVTATGAGAAFPVGTKITIAGLADATTTELNGTWTVTANATNTVSFVSNATTAIALASPTGTPTVKGTTGTITTQSIAAGTASTAAGAAITITPWA
jgi:hypothetical protein